MERPRSRVVQTLGQLAQIQSRTWSRARSFELPRGSQVGTMGEFAEMMMWLYHSSFCSIEAILLIHILVLFI